MRKHEPLVGEPLALDLVNTRPADADLLDGGPALLDWIARQAERTPELAVFDEASPALVAAAVRIRGLVDASVTALLADRPVPQSAIEALNLAQRAAPSYRRLSADGGIFTVVTERLGSREEQLAAILAEAAGELLADPAIARLKQCEADDCRLVFLQTHPRRRWCSAERCGNRVRVARYYQSRKHQD